MGTSMSAPAQPAAQHAAAPAAAEHAQPQHAAASPAAAEAAADPEDVSLWLPTEAKQWYVANKLWPHTAAGKPAEYAPHCYLCNAWTNWDNGHFLGFMHRERRKNPWYWCPVIPTWEGPPDPPEGSSAPAAGATQVQDCRATAALRAAGVVPASAAGAAPEGQYQNEQHAAQGPARGLQSSAAWAAVQMTQSQRFPVVGQAPPPEASAEASPLLVHTSRRVDQVEYRMDDIENGMLHILDWFLHHRNQANAATPNMPQ